MCENNNAPIKYCFQDAIRELKSGSGVGVDAASLIDHTVIKAQLSKALEEKKLLASQYEVSDFALAFVGL